MVSVYKIVVGKPERRNHSEGLGRDGDNFTMVSREIELEGVD
jgi:hypothetical protein